MSERSPISTAAEEEFPVKRPGEVDIESYEVQFFTLKP